MDNAAQQMAKAAYINAQTACAMIEAMGMVAENQICIKRNCAPIYNKKSFDDLSLAYGIYHNNTITELFRN